MDGNKHGLKHWQVFYHYINVYTEIKVEGSIVIRAKSEQNARIDFAGMQPMQGNYCKIDFVTECDVWWD